MSERHIPQEVYRQIRLVGLLFMVPIVIGVWPIAGYFLGDYIRQKWDWPMYTPLICAILGFAAGIVEIKNIFKCLPKDQNKNGTLS